MEPKAMQFDVKLHEDHPVFFVVTPAPEGIPQDPLNLQTHYAPEDNTAFSMYGVSGTISAQLSTTHKHKRFHHKEIYSQSATMTIDMSNEAGNQMAPTFRFALTKYLENPKFGGMCKAYSISDKLEIRLQPTNESPLEQITNIYRLLRDLEKKYANGEKPLGEIQPLEKRAAR